MNTIFGTHLHVLANTHPELKDALVKLTKARLTEGSLERYQNSPIYNGIISDMASIISSYSSNYHRLNLVLTRLNAIINLVSEVNYEHLSEKQRAELPELAGEVDKTNNHIREDIFPATTAGKENAFQNINEILIKGQEYVEHVHQQQEEQMQNINAALGTNAQLDEGLGIVSQQDLDKWLDRNTQVDQKLISKLLDERGEIEGFCKVILALEVLIFIAKKNSDTKEKEMKKAVKYITKLSFVDIKFMEIKATEGRFVAELREYDERSLKLEEIFQGYPRGDEALDPSVVKDLDRLSKPKDMFTSVDGDDN
mgnify:CR=1 FL=1